MRRVTVKYEFYDADLNWKNWEIEKKRNKNVSFYLNISLPVRIFLVAVWFLDPSFNHPVKDLEILKYDLWLTDRI